MENNQMKKADKVDKSKKTGSGPETRDKVKGLIGLSSYPAVSVGIVVKEYDVLHVDPSVSRQKLVDGMSRAESPVIALVNGLGELPKIKGLDVRPIVFDSFERLHKAGIEIADAEVDKKTGDLRPKIRNLVAKDVIALARSVANGEKWAGPSTDSLALSIPVIIHGTGEPQKEKKAKNKVVVSEAKAAEPATKPAKTKKLALIDWDTVDVACSTVTAQLAIPREKRMTAIMDIRSKMVAFVLTGDTAWEQVVEKLSARGAEEDALDVLTHNVRLARKLVEQGPASTDERRILAAKKLVAAVKAAGKKKLMLPPVEDEAPAVSSVAKKILANKGAALPSVAGKKR